MNRFCLPLKDFMIVKSSLTNYSVRIYCGTRKLLHLVPRLRTKVHKVACYKLVVLCSRLESSERPRDLLWSVLTYYLLLLLPGTGILNCYNLTIRHFGLLWLSCGPVTINIQLPGACLLIAWAKYKIILVTLVYGLRRFWENIENNDDKFGI